MIFQQEACNYFQRNWTSKMTIQSTSCLNFIDIQPVQHFNSSYKKQILISKHDILTGIMNRDCGTRAHTANKSILTQ